MNWVFEILSSLTFCLRIGKTLWPPFCCRRSSQHQHHAKEEIHAECVGADVPSAGTGPIHPGGIQRGQGKLDEAVKAGSTRASPHAAQGWPLKSSQALDRGGARGLTGVKWCWPFSPPMVPHSCLFPTRWKQSL